MRAAVYNEYGSPEVLHVEEMEKPVPKDTEIRIRVHATSVNYGDLSARRFKEISPREFNMTMLFWFMAKLYFGLNKPKVRILGSEFSGVVDAVGSAVTRFQKGDAVFGYLGQGMGAYAEYFCMPEKGVIAKKPGNISFEEAAVIAYGAIMAWYLVDKAGIGSGQKVLINGASGAIGSAAVQIAKIKGAIVTGVCGTAAQDYVKALGADNTIDYREEDFTRNGETYDVIFDVRGRLLFSACKNSLKPKGILFYTSFKMKHLLRMLQTKSAGGKQVICAIAPGSVNDLHAVKEQIETGRIKALIDKRFPLEEATEAHRYAESGEKKGKIVITVRSNEQK